MPPLWECGWRWSSFLGCHHPPFVEIRVNPEFHDLMRMDKSHWPRCLLCHGWLPSLSGVNGHSLWAESAAEGAGNLLERSLGSYSSRQLREWEVPAEFDREDAVRRMPGNLNVWSDGSVVLDKVSRASSGGFGMFAHVSGDAWRFREWGHLDLVQPARGSGMDSCRSFCSVSRPLQTVQRDELWGDVLAFNFWSLVLVISMLLDTLVVFWMMLRLLGPLSWKLMVI